jgi:hypothetical protein
MSSTLVRAEGWHGLLHLPNEGKTALNRFLLRVGAGGHNNIKINPVFRGMVRGRFGPPGFQPKEKSD